MDRIDLLESLGYMPTGESYRGGCIVDMAMAGEMNVVCKTPNYALDSNREIEASEKAVNREGSVLEELAEHLPELPVPHTVDLIPEDHLVVTEYLPGQNLLHRLGPNPTQAQVVEGIRMASGAAVHLHDLGYVHGDLHFGNILDYEGGMLIDFGGSGTLEEHAKGDAIRIQTAFSPMELYDGEPLTCATDVFTLGVSGFAAVVGKSDIELLEEIAEAGSLRPLYSMLERELDIGGLLNNEFGMLLANMMEEKEENRPAMWDVYSAAWQLRSILSH